MITAGTAYCKSPKLLRGLTVLALVFGAASIFSGGMVLFGSKKAAKLRANISSSLSGLIFRGIRMYFGGNRTLTARQMGGLPRIDNRDCITRSLCCFRRLYI